MAKPRKRNDQTDTVYQVGNSLLGEPGKFILNQKQMNKLDRLIQQLKRLYCVKILSYSITPSGYTLVCSAPAALPTPQELQNHYYDRYREDREMPNFDNFEIYTRWAERLRNFSCLIKDLEQCFTRWFNKTSGTGKRRGTIWNGRFKSFIISARKQFNQCISRLSSCLAPSGKTIRKKTSFHWDKLCEKHPFLDDMLPTVQEIGKELPFLILKCIFDGPRGGPFR